MAIEKDLLDFYRAGVQKVCDRGQYGNTFYIFEYDGKLMSTNNLNGGVGKLVGTVYADRKGDVTQDTRGNDGFSRSEPAVYATPPGDGTGKL
jgi:hypothetical protein